MRSELPPGEEGGKREHVWTESELKIRRGDETKGAANADDRSCRGEIFAHRLLDEHRCAPRQLLQYARNLISGHGEVEHSIRGASRLGE